MRISAAAPMKVGNTSGSGKSACHMRLRGTSQRVVSQARAVPNTAVEADTSTASRRVRSSGPWVRWENSTPNGSLWKVKLRQTS